MAPRKLGRGSFPGFGRPEFLREAEEVLANKTSKGILAITVVHITEQFEQIVFQRTAHVRTTGESNGANERAECLSIQLNLGGSKSFEASIGGGLLRDG